MPSSVFFMIETVSYMQTGLIDKRGLIHQKIRYIAFAVDFSVSCRAWQAFHYWVACDPPAHI